MSKTKQIKKIVMKQGNYIVTIEEKRKEIKSDKFEWWVWGEEGTNAPANKFYACDKYGKQDIELLDSWEPSAPIHRGYNDILRGIEISIMLQENSSKIKAWRRAKRQPINKLKEKYEKLLNYINEHPEEFEFLKD